MKTANGLLSAALAALLACSGNTDDLKPKTAADCGMLQKPCGYRCVSVLDAATGCGDPDSCEPCGGGLFAYCDPSTYLCSGSIGGCIPVGASEADCDGAGACENLDTDARHCGACGHACEPGFGCDSGTCDGPTIAAGTSARGITFHAYDGKLYWVDDGNNGRLMQWDPASGTFGAGWANEVLGNLDSVASPPAVSLVSSNPLFRELLVVGREPPDEFTIYRWDPASPTVKTRHWGGTFSYPSARIEGLALAGDTVVYTRSDLVQPQITDGLTVASAPTGATTDPVRGLAPYGGSVYYGYSSTGMGTLAWMDAAGLETLVAGGFVGAPHRVAVSAGPPFVHAWANEFVGSVWRLVDGGSLPVELQAASGLAGRMDVAVDGEGVYWLDARDRSVWEWRNDGTKIQLGRGLAPNGLAVDANFVYVSDDAGWIRRFPK